MYSFEKTFYGAGLVGMDGKGYNMFYSGNFGYTCSGFSRSL